MPTLKTADGKQIAVHPFYMVMAERIQNGDGDGRPLTRLTINKVDHTETIDVEDDFNIVADFMDT